MVLMGKSRLTMISSADPFARLRRVDTHSSPFLRNICDHSAPSSRKTRRQRRHTEAARKRSLWEDRWVGIREIISTGMRLPRGKEFLHSRMAANAVVASRSSWETASKVNLQRYSARHSSTCGMNFCNIRRRICHALQLFVESEDELRKR